MTIDVDIRPVGTGPREPGVSGTTARAVDGLLYPVGLAVKGRRCLVVGGGAVAARKVRSLLQCGASVTMVAPEVQRAVQILIEDHAIEADVHHRLRVQRRCYERGEAADYRLVVAATGLPEVDGAVYEDAEVAGVWVNSADDPAHCSMLLPAVWRSGVVTVSVSTDGASPALAVWIRARLAESLGEHMGRLAVLLGEARQQLKEEGRRTDSVDWSAVLEGPVPALVAEGRVAEARVAIRTATRTCDQNVTLAESGGASPTVART